MITYLYRWRLGRRIIIGYILSRFELKRRHESLQQDEWNRQGNNEIAIWWESKRIILINIKLWIRKIEIE